MDAKRLASVVLGTLLVLGNARAQGVPGAAPTLPPPASPIVDRAAPTNPIVVSTPPTGVPPTGVQYGPQSPGGYDVPGISNWIRYGDNDVVVSKHGRPHGCNCPFGKNTAIGQELYFRTGVSVPVGNEILTRNATTGFTVEGGARTLFFNQSYTAAWVVDTGIVNTYNSAVATPEKFTINGLRPGVVGFQDFQISARDINRTMVNLGLGREWFSTPAHDQAACWRYGVDFGARYGTMRLNLNELVHRTDVIGGAYLGTHVAYEFPCHNYVLNVGFRTEYAYTWTDIFQRASDFGEVNLLGTIGIRY